MRTLKAFLVAVAFVLLSEPFSAHANIVYDWTGTCQPIVPPGTEGGGCIGQATMHVVTTDAYVPGELFSVIDRHPTNPVLLEALYSDNGVSFDLAPHFLLNGMSFLLPTSVPNSIPDFGGGGGVSLTQEAVFHSDGSGVWRFQGEGLRPGCDPLIGGLCAYLAIGVNGVWTRVPEPSTLVLLGVA